MKFANITLGSNVEIDPSTSINNVVIKNNVRIAKRCSIFGGPDNQLELGENVYVGMSSVLNGFAAKLKIGDNVSISQFVNIMVDSGPNASPGMLRLFPIMTGSISIGNDCWIGASSIIMPDVVLGEYCIVAAHSFVNKSFPAFSIIGGCPARLIRSFTDAEKEIMLDDSDKSSLSVRNNYEKNYIDLPFEDMLREYRRKHILKLLKQYSHRRFLEIGCGPDPLFTYIEDFEKMTVLEPGEKFFNMALSISKGISNIVIINDLIENVTDDLQLDTFDFIVIGGFLHEVTNPDLVLKAVQKLCSRNTLVYSFVPNARSFHRLWAYKSETIENIYQKSEHDHLFKRNQVYDIKSFNELLTRNNFKVLESGTYFVKPFSHDQMCALIDHGIINSSHIEGLDKMIEFMPDLGAELWNICKIDDKV